MRAVIPIRPGGGTGWAGLGQEARPRHIGAGAGYMLHDHSYLALRPEWVLRNDGRKVILYLMSYDELRYQILDPATGAIAPFLDGQRTVAELIETLRYIGDLVSADEARTVLETVVRALNTDQDKVAVMDRPPPWRVDYDPAEFMVSPEDFAPTRRLTRPLSLMIQYSGWCQTDCVYCYADLANMRKLPHLSVDQWRPILRQARDLDIRIVQLTGGDPLGRRDSIDFLTHLIELGFLFMVSTKCHVSAADARRLVGAGFNKPVNGVNRDFQVSIDSADPVVVDQLMRRKGHLRRAIETVRNLLAAGIPVRVKAVLTPLNFDQVDDYVRTFADLGVNRFYFSTYARSYYRHHDSLFMDDDMKAEVAGRLGTAVLERPELSIEGDAIRFAPAPPGETRRSMERWATRAGCSAGRTNLGVAPNGRAVVCEQMPLARPFFVGDLTRQSILEVWNSPELLEFVYPPRERFAGTPCHDCPEFDACIYELGYCFRDSFFAYGRLHQAPPDCPRAPEGAPRLT